MDNLNARNLAVVVLKRMGREGEAEAMLSETRRLDRLDIWSRYLKAGEKPKDNRLRMDLALDYARAGFWDDAIALLASADTERLDGSAPMVVYMLAWCQASRGDHEVASATYRKAAQAPPLYCFPNLLEEIEILQAAIAADPADARAPYYLGNLLYDRRRHEEAIELWELSARLDSSFATVWRNLAFAYFNILHQEDKARNAFDRAFAANPQDARVLYERDQLWKRIGESPETRLRELEHHPDLVSKRDDLAVELATLYDQTGKPDQALNLLKARKFQPWEGGEGLVLGQWMRANLMMGRQSLAKREAAKALSYIEAALAPPENLGEARHLLANQSEIFYWAGVAASNLGDAAQARSWWEKAAASRGDFREMTVQSVSEMTYWSALAFLRLGRQAEAHELLRAIESYSWELEKQTPKIDYFATSLPAMLLFEENLARRNLIEARFLRAQALLGLDRTSEAAVLLNSVLEKDRNQLRAADLLQDLMEQSATGPRN
jgi:tetratricopeptide (TPR) repeat protein